VIECSGVTVNLGEREVLAGVGLKIGRGEWVSIVGPNGAGKSTLLRYICGLVPGRGECLLDGRPSASLSRRERSLLVALVPQSPVVPDGARVFDYVLLGRSPHIRPLRWEGVHDVDTTHDALEQLDLLDLGDRLIATLSGGEQQRVFLARALAQGAPIVLLDEPTTALDIGHQQQVLDLVDRLRYERGLTVCTTMHDLSLAGQYAERLLLIDGGRVVVEGPPGDVLTEENLTRHYGARVRVIHDGDRPAILPIREMSRPEGRTDD
jgi:iron complex transport system ATP-binding protein